MPSLLVLIPLFGVLILNLPLRDFMRRISFSVAFALFLAQMTLAIYHHSDRGGGASLDHLSFIALLSIGIVSLSSLTVGRYIINSSDDMFNFINLLMIASIGMTGVVMAKDIFRYWYKLRSCLCNPKTLRPRDSIAGLDAFSVRGTLLRICGSGPEGTVAAPSRFWA